MLTRFRGHRSFVPPVFFPPLPLLIILAVPMPRVHYKLLLRRWDTALAASANRFRNTTYPRSKWVDSLSHIPSFFRSACCCVCSTLWKSFGPSSDTGIPPHADRYLAVSDNRTNRCRHCRLDVICNLFLQTPITSSFLLLLEDKLISATFPK